jgi:hypothetical protein
MKIEITPSDIWRLLETDYRYIAQDKSGSWYAYKEKPDIGENEWVDGANKDPWSPYVHYVLITATDVKNPNWMNTLQERPKNQAQ